MDIFIEVPTYGVGGGEEKTNPSLVPVNGVWDKTEYRRSIGIICTKWLP